MDSECEFRKLTYEYALKQTPKRVPLLPVFDALELETMCGEKRPVPAEKEYWPQTYPVRKEDRLFFVDPGHGRDSNSGAIGSPLKSLAKAVEASRQPGNSTTTIVLRAGQHYLEDTIALGPEDEGLNIQNYEGEAAWVSGGRKLETSWTHVNSSKPAPQTCTDACAQAGHCCADPGVSSYQHPSCIMGCALAKEPRATIDTCVTACHSIDNTCDWARPSGLSGNNCGSCKAGCDASDGVQECVLGCNIALGGNIGPNIYVTDVTDDSISSIGGLMSVEPHVRYMRARWPNPPTGTQEFRPFANVQPVEWHAPSKLPKAEQVFINATERDGFKSSLQEDYNYYVSGNCKELHDVNCPCAAWSDVRAGEWTSSSYWCSDRASGGWAIMDTGNGFYVGFKQRANPNRKRAQTDKDVARTRPSLRSSTTRVETERPDSPYGLDLRHQQRFDQPKVAGAL